MQHKQKGCREMMVIAIDYDGTIADTNREKATWIETHLGMVVSPWDCSRTNCVPIIGLDAYELMSDWVYERSSTLQAAPVPGALDALRALAQRAELHIVTARPPRRIAFAREWLEHKEMLQFIAGIETSVGRMSKAEVCATLGANVLVDDDARHLLKADVPGLVRILLQHGREESIDCGSEVRVCASWQQILDLLEKLV
jgi:hypothetical protein